MKYYIIAGEASGDLHGSHLIRALKDRDLDAIFRFWGGDQMESASQQSAVKHIKDLAFMGFVEVLMNIRTILKLIKLCKKDLQEFEPDALILIDYPGFNIRMAEWVAKSNKKNIFKKKIKTFFYISPQVWAWKSKRVHRIIPSIEEMYAILPFEKAFYKEYGYDVQYVGHPLLENFKKKPIQPFQLNSNKPIIALLPGSRQQEIKRILPEMMGIVPLFPQYQFVLAAAPSIDIDFYKNIINNIDIIIVQNETYPLLQSAEAALVTSGTATLETGLLKCPQIVLYKGSFLSYLIAKRLIKVNYISLVNLIMNRKVVTELIQGDCNSKKIAEELAFLLKDKSNILNHYEALHEKLLPDNPSEVVATDIIHKLKKS